MDAPTAPTHTFGGSAMDRHMFDFETVADAGGTAGAPAGGEPSPTTPASPAAPAPAGAAPGGESVTPPADATETAPAWSPDDPAFAQAVDDRALAIIEQRFGPLEQLLANQFVEPGTQQQTAQPGQLLPPDPFSDNYAQEFAAYQQARDEQLLTRFEGMLGQIAQPLQAQQQQATIAEGEQRIQDIIADEVARNGDFPRLPGETESKAQNLIKPLAEAMFPQIAARYGSGTRAAEIAIQQASATVRAIIAEAKAAGATEHQNHLGTLAGARGEPGAAGAAGVATIADRVLSPRELAQKYSGQATAIRGSAV